MATAQHTRGDRMNFTIKKLSNGDFVVIYGGTS